MGSKVFLLIGLACLLGDFNIYSQSNLSLMGVDMFTQEDSLHLSKTVYDANNLPLLNIKHGRADVDSVYYIGIDGCKRRILLPMKNAPYYHGGADSINAFITRNRKISDTIELQSLYLVFVLFDNFKIEDVRIYRRFGFKDNLYDQEVKRLVLMMIDNWCFNSVNEGIPIGVIFPLKLP